MKKLFGFLFTILVVYVIYLDLTVGTLPSAIPEHAEASSKTTMQLKTNIPYFQKEVNPGETVISIVEHQLGKSLPVSISDLIRDFQLLNGGKSPEKIQIGSTYHFPDYSK